MSDAVQPYDQYATAAPAKRPIIMWDLVTTIVLLVLMIGAALLAALAAARHGLPAGGSVGPGTRVTALVRRRPPDFAAPAGEGAGAIRGLKQRIGIVMFNLLVRMV